MPDNELAHLQLEIFQMELTQVSAHSGLAELPDKEQSCREFCIIALHRTDVV